ncbi:NTE family protein [Alkalispirochaeta americana]|uniref:NTE family protein n=1 Tax=Alkalispirochaeta americana TaxID=159291 RepID=A0A1N6VBR4_9SPIO|nr:patatin-like phospholipase family protein [Alkalispirochaeta americana]SIQ75272.1 NTE family protein [Alkalispirochaeta americana]
MRLLRSLGRSLVSHRPKALGLALGGGAARGIAHIGAIKVLQEEDIPIAAVAGTSIGSIIGAMYCAGMSWEEMWELSQEITWGELLRPSFSGLGLVKTDRMEEILTDRLGNISFEDLLIPLTAVAVDIVNASPILLQTGPVAQAVRASSSVPGIFEPLRDGERVLVDGGVVDNLPARVVREMGAEAVLAIDLNKESSDGRIPRNLLDVMSQTFAVLIWNTSRLGRESADILLQPEIAHIGYHELSCARELFDAGEQAMRKALPALKALA